MGMDVDYVVAKDAIEELQRLLQRRGHLERKEITDDIIEFVKLMKVKYNNK